MKTHFKREKRKEFCGFIRFPRKKFIIIIGISRYVYGCVDGLWFSSYNHKLWSFYSKHINKILEGNVYIRMLYKYVNAASWSIGFRLHFMYSPETALSQSMLMLIQTLFVLPINQVHISIPQTPPLPSSSTLKRGNNCG